jgi:hypothetical protein
MDALPLLVVLALVALGGGLMALGFWAYPKLRTETQGYPHEKAIEALLLPWIYNGILSAYKVSETAVDEIQQRIRGADKAGIAGALYDMLPAKIGNVPLDVVKMAISRDRFAELVQAAFFEFDEFFEGKEADYEALLEEWLEANRPRG